MLLKEKHYQCINLLCQGKEVAEVAKEMGTNRSNVYYWLKDKDFKSELDKAEQEIRNQTIQTYIHKLPSVTKRLYELTQQTEDKRTALGAIREWNERGLGKVITPVEVSGTEQEDYSIEDALKRINNSASASEEDASL